ncbi:PEP-CTERM sorting domain-containing protein [Rubripirellula reticaptiva]|uniref:PEP-CTERM motif protein n=1 Tax=Rubripirellula reticaptiva TaxID=2528013 RepID=A0A5C6EGP4_9BACT|nr:PEP-CTERM sorting domain-containing protein [Rubripirellula reticaptiva]TWU47978.1 PEP-CTERM motif protein [Rubripirellula reticaptiva]
MNKTYLMMIIAGLIVLGSLMSSAQAGMIIYSENFGNLVDQAPLVASDGNASLSFGANATIGDTNAAGDAAAGGIYASAGATSGLSTRNGVRGYTTVANAGFTTASGSVGQLHTHTANGFGVLSTGPITTVNGVGNQPTPIVLSSPAAGDIIRVEFDMYVQATRTLTTSLGVNWNLKDASFAVISFTDTWNDYANAMVGDVIAVQKDLTITEAMITAGLNSIGPQFTFGNNSGDVAVNTAFAQIDNFTVEHITAVPEPSSLALIGLGFIGVVVRRRRK